MTALEDALSSIQAAWKQGRVIVPFIGSGFSVDSGMPVVQGIEAYLAQLHVYLQKAIYLGLRPDDPKRNLFEEICQHYLQHPELFVRDLQWPDRFVLHQQLCKSNIWIQSAVTDVASRQTMHDLVGLAYYELFLPSIGWKQDHILVKDAQDKKLTSAQIGHLFHSLFGDWRDLINRFTNYSVDLTDALIQSLHSRRRPGTSHQYLAYLARLNLWHMILTFNFDQFIERAFIEQQLPHRVFGMEYGDTFPDHQLVDGSLAVVKLHGDTHRLLMDQRLDRPLSKAYLDRLDDCLRKSHSGPPLFVVLGCGGTEERCLSMIRHFCDRPSPHDKDPLVLWVHYEPLEQVSPLLGRCLPVESRPERSAFDGAQRPGSDADFRRNILVPALRDHRIHLVQAKNPGYFLMHLYSHLSTRHPASRTPYIAHVDRPLGVALRNDATRAPLPKPRPAVALFDGYRHESNSLDADTATEHLADYINGLDSSVYPLWIDLEDCYSVVDVVGRIVEQARRYDTNLAPGVFQLDPPDEKLLKLDRIEDRERSRVIRKAADRVWRILQRGTFCIAFDAVEAIGWPPTVHHGDIEAASAFSEKHREDMFKFLQRLVAKSRDSKRTKRDFFSLDFGSRSHESRSTSGFRGSSIAIAINPPNVRYPDERDDQVVQKWREKILEITKFVKEREDQGESEGWNVIYREVAKTTTQPGFAITENESLPLPLPRISSELSPLLAGRTDGPLIMFRLVTCRRTRHLVALRQLLRPLLHSDEAVDGLLHELTNGKVLTHVEGGGYWMRRPLRDSYYTKATSWTSPKKLQERPNGEVDSPELSGSAAQLWLTFAEHDRWADWYYDHNHRHSTDPHAFFEYVYHRVTSLRLITVLLAMAAKAPLVVFNAIRESLNAVNALTGNQDWFLRSAHEIFAPYFEPDKSPVTSVDGSIDEVSKQNILLALNAIRLSRLRWLAAVWKVAGDDLSLTTGAERCIFWIRWLLTIDIHLLRFPPRDVGQQPPSQMAERELKSMAGVEFNSLEYSQQLGSLQHSLLQLWLNMAISRMDYDTAQKLTDLLRPGQIGHPELSQLEGLKERELFRHVQYWRTVGSQAVFGVDDKKHPATHRTAMCLAAANHLESLGKLDPGERPHSWTLDARVTRLRLLLDADECGWIEEEAKKPEFWTKLVKATEEANHGAHDWLADHDVSDPLFRMQCAWLHISGARLALRVDQADDPVDLSQRFATAYRELEAARSLVNEGPSHFRGIVELYAARSALQHVEWLLLNVPPTDSTTEAVQKASGKLRSAEAALTRAHAYLREGRRNTRWWREYFNLDAKFVCWQLARDWSALPDCATSDRLNEVDKISLEGQKRVVNLLRCLRRGLSAIRRRADLQSEPLLHVRDLLRHAGHPFLMYEAMYCLGAASIHRLSRSENLKPERAADYLSAFNNQLEWYATSVGFQTDEDVVKLWPKWAERASAEQLPLILGKSWRELSSLPNFRMWQNTTSKRGTDSPVRALKVDEVLL